MKKPQAEGNINPHMYSRGHSILLKKERKEGRKKERKKEINTNVMFILSHFCLLVLNWIIEVQQQRHWLIKLDYCRFW